MDGKFEGQEVEGLTQGHKVAYPASKSGLLFQYYKDGSEPQHLQIGFLHKSWHVFHLFINWFIHSLIHPFNKCLLKTNVLSTL